ncbi:hypothetical protein DT23_07305 [Thioclava indica]|uniref:Uncharacterized protein n=1 Tax=Thioclava indica TaxID=1353528 RepID=A0A074J9E6_9RHOB|nr:hypothetical protein DT23_07305 [Thioclava indica]
MLREILSINALPRLFLERRQNCKMHYPFLAQHARAESARGVLTFAKIA